MNRRHMLGSAALAAIGAASARTADAAAKGVSNNDAPAHLDVELLRLADQFFTFSAERERMNQLAETYPLGHPEYDRLWREIYAGVGEYHERLNVICAMPAHTPAGWLMKARLLRYRAEYDSDNDPTPGDDALMVSVAAMIEAAFPA